MKYVLALFAVLFCGLAHAQDALVVQTCGTLPQAYASGATRQLTVDVNGKLCGLGAIGTAVNITSFGASASATDNATAIQSALNAAVSQGVPLYIPAAATCYKYTAPLTISGNLSVVGDWIAGNWNNNINVPAGSPALLGSVLCPTANGSDAIDIAGTSLTVNFANIGILFQTTFGQSSTTTGDGIHYVATTTQGLSGSEWRNVWVYGHDGNHYAYNLGNAIYNNFYDCFSYGGGGWNLTGNGISGNYGNSTFVGVQNQLLVGGSAFGISISATSINNLNLLQFINPQVNLVNQVGVTPVANPPTAAQLVLSVDANSTFNSFSHSDFSGNIAGRAATVYAGHGNFYDFLSGFWDVAISSPAWTTNGIAFPSGNPETLTDTTSSGTVAVAATTAFPSSTIKATSPVTYTNYATLYLPVPIGGANVTIPSPLSLYAAGSITTNAAMTAVSGYFSPSTLSIYNTTTPPAGGTAGTGIKLSNVSNFGVFFGTGVPTLSAAKGSLYLRRDGTTTNDRMYVNTDGATTWTAVTTAL